VEAAFKDNRLRTDCLEKFQQLINEYNAGAANVEQIYERLKFFEVGGVNRVELAL
jgi:hypothetical protein